MPGKGKGRGSKKVATNMNSEKTQENVVDSTTNQKDENIVAEANDTEKLTGLVENDKIVAAGTKRKQQNKEPEQEQKQQQQQNKKDTSMENGNDNEENLIIPEKRGRGGGGSIKQATKKTTGKTNKKSEQNKIVEEEEEEELKNESTPSPAPVVEKQPTTKAGKRGVGNKRGPAASAASLAVIEPTPVEVKKTNNEMTPDADEDVNAVYTRPKRTRGKKSAEENGKELNSQAVVVVKKHAKGGKLKGAAAAAAGEAKATVIASKKIAAEKQKNAEKEITNGDVVKMDAVPEPKKREMAAGRGGTVRTAAAKKESEKFENGVVEVEKKPIRTAAAKKAISGGTGGTTRGTRKRAAVPDETEQDNHDNIFL